jgi:hypothetical protein
VSVASVSSRDSGRDRSHKSHRLRHFKPQPQQRRSEVGGGPDLLGVTPWSCDVCGGLHLLHDMLPVTRGALTH